MRFNGYSNMYNQSMVNESAGVINVTATTNDYAFHTNLTMLIDVSNRWMGFHQDVAMPLFTQYMAQHPGFMYANSSDNYLSL
jgi:hypothetical protein